MPRGTPLHVLAVRTTQPWVQRPALLIDESTGTSRLPYY